MFSTVQLSDVLPSPYLTGWSKASLSVDVSEENDGSSSSEDPMNSDPEDDVGKKLVRQKLPRVFFSYILKLANLYRQQHTWL